MIGMFAAVVAITTGFVAGLALILVAALLFPPALLLVPILFAAFGFTIYAWVRSAPSTQMVRVRQPNRSYFMTEHPPHVQPQPMPIVFPHHVHTSMDDPDEEDD